MRFMLVLCSCLVLGGCSTTRNFVPAATQSASPTSAMLSVAAGSPQRFKATFKDPKGGSHIGEVTVSIMTDKVVPGGRSRWSANECLMRYDIASNAIWLVPDIGGTWGSHPIIGGSSSTFSNSQCTVVASGSSVEVSGDTVTVYLELKFPPQFIGTKQLYLASADVDGKWSANYQQQFGSFMIAAAP
ncbi:MAG: hypothetical protein ABSA39_13685 [Edaphobacter sp.]